MAGPPQGSDKQILQSAVVEDAQVVMFSVSGLELTHRNSVKQQETGLHSWFCQTCQPSTMDGAEIRTVTLLQPTRALARGFPAEHGNFTRPVSLYLGSRLAQPVPAPRAQGFSPSACHLQETSGRVGFLQGPLKHAAK